MALRESPFANGFIAGLHSLSWWLIFPCFWFMDRMIAVCLPTTLEKKQQHEEACYLGPLRVFFGFLVFLALFVLTAPVALIGFLMWVPLQLARRPFIYFQRTTTNPEEGAVKNLAEAKESFSFVTANLCLLPDSLARFNNLGHSQARSKQIGQTIIQSVNRPRIKSCVVSPSSDTMSHCSRDNLLPPSPYYGSIDSQLPSRPCLEFDSSLPLEEVVCESGGGEGGSSTNVADIIGGTKQNAGKPDVSPDAAEVMNGTNFNQNSNRCKDGWKSHKDIPWEISPLFPANTDFVCLQEVFDKRAAQKLKDILSPIFSHMLYDVGIYAFHGCCSSFKFFNSGLFFASRYPVLDASFHCYPNGRGEDALAAKGLLCVKVQVGRNPQKNIVGYFNCTHLHAPEADAEIRCAQLTLVSQWISDFQALTKKDDEIVVFDTLCGDFNFDNCSPDDSQEQKHKIFDDYRDPCRVGPGQDKPWVTGTLLEQPTMYDEEVLTSESLQRSLSNEAVRRRFIAPPVGLDNCSCDYQEPGAPWAGRRIDYMLYRESTLSQNCKTVSHLPYMLYRESTLSQNCKTVSHLPYVLYRESTLSQNCKTVSHLPYMLYRESTLSQNCKTEIEEFTFITQLAGLTDHIPVGMRLCVSVNTEDL
ncbi:sphingomyelin phosphodiesterase 5 isoform X2 [Polyodon spathula]|uniref:sphingomyelin phosphodiesterase 5 isoform X2 n=1 Tax=Polyodon spathula TaxID=7913 RepID=UPI001B7F4BD0|nr:sphingomyelin phosphodiesterase 5 isoform X2 [Polyodon spathula]